MGATHPVIASNLTYHWFDGIDVEMLHVIALTCETLRAMEVERVGLLASITAREIGLYEEFLGEITPVYPADMDVVMDAMYRYKAGEEAAAEREMR